MSSHVVIPVLAAFAVSLVLGPIVIPFLRKLKMKQTERVEGVQSHLKKGELRRWAALLFLRCYCDIPVLCERLSEDHSGFIPYSGVWFDRIS